MATAGEEFVFTRDQVRALDALAVEAYGIPGVVLMENAGGGAARFLLERAQAELGLAAPALTVRVLCGPGNNGGDGCVLARHLDAAGARVALLSVAPRERLRGDAAWAAEAARRGGLEAAVPPDAEAWRAAARGWQDVDVVVDALLGTGARGAPRGSSADALAALAAWRGAGDRRRVLALDLPSGLDADTGEAGEPCGRADWTATFAARKPGLALAPDRVGRVAVVPIGVPSAALRRVRSP